MAVGFDYPRPLEIHDPAIIILELGGNDGLRGYPIDNIRENIDAMTALALEADVEVLLIGMVLPPNYGKRYIDAFTEIFPTIAEKRDIPFLPFLLDGIATEESLVQRDGIHPKPEAQSLILDQVWEKLKPMLKRSGASDTQE
ncbi:MAG: GDSL-type esterase/lipase family protein [Gammaproteobacteria bacterium]|nr:GDSL-type esterase/lipase family protein [Gammaproteobacteria bacterium]